jgi:hypothetical protein
MQRPLPVKEGDPVGHRLARKCPCPCCRSGQTVVLADQRQVLFFNEVLCADLAGREASLPYPSPDGLGITARSLGDLGDCKHDCSILQPGAPTGIPTVLPTLKASAEGVVRERQFLVSPGRGPFRLLIALCCWELFGGRIGPEWGLTSGRPERSDPLTVGRPPASWTAAPPLTAAGFGGPGGSGRSAVKGGPGNMRLSLRRSAPGTKMRKAC